MVIHHISKTSSTKSCIHHIITVPYLPHFTSYNTCQCKPPGNTDDHRYADHIIGLNNRRQDQDQQKGRNTSAHFRKPHHNRIHLWTCCSTDTSVGNTDHSNNRSSQKPDHQRNPSAIPDQ